MVPTYLHARLTRIVPAWIHTAERKTVDLIYAAAVNGALEFAALLIDWHAGSYQVNLLVDILQHWQGVDFFLAPCLFASLQGTGKGPAEKAALELIVSKLPKAELETKEVTETKKNARTRPRKKPPGPPRYGLVLPETRSAPWPIGRRRSLRAYATYDWSHSLCGDPEDCRPRHGGRVKSKTLPRVYWTMKWWWVNSWRREYWIEGVTPRP